MVDYSYVPNTPNTKSRNNAGNSENNKDYIGDFVQNNKKNIKIMATILIAVFALYFLGSGITGNVLLSDTDRQLASSADFPQLSKFDANKQYFLCNNDLTVTNQQKLTTQTQLDTTTTNLNTCRTEQTQITNELTSTKTSLSTHTTNLNLCTSDKTQIQNNLDLAEVERDTFKDDLDELQEDFDKITDRYAEIKCCEENDDGEIENGYKIRSNGYTVSCYIYDSDDDDMLKLNC
ncbi:hypothetical protein GQ473_06240 [archaeon]|nr:hypothetical protein [archaeon]